MASTTTLRPSHALGAQGQNASKSHYHTLPSTTAAPTRPRPPHTQSAPALATQPLKASGAASDASTVSEPASAPERPVVSRGYTAHLPYNPDRPPPHTYTRQHEFPPFPPLAQHPALPFLTTAFVNTQESQSAPPPKARPSLSSRVSASGRHNHSMVSTIPTMDVSKNDPSATFIHPPLVVPLSRSNDPSIDPSCLNEAIDGEPAPGTPLTYAILHSHRNWFLDADDFRKDNPNRIDYPPDLEPPRGWAPLSECTGAGAANRCKQAKEKKEKSIAVRTKGSYAHPDHAATDVAVEFGPSDGLHEKTVLRCTFCRREYHGPNAKSMWRRHVYDKHKVAMKNRREGSAGMAPKLSQAQKKAKANAAEPSNALGPPVELSPPTPTLDLTNEENVLRILEFISTLDISLPAALTNSSNDYARNLEIISQALQKNSICLPAEDSDVSNPQRTTSISHTSSNSELSVPLKKTTTKSRKRDEQRRERERRDEEIMRAAAGPSLGVDDDEEMMPSQVSLSSITADDTPWTGQPEKQTFKTSSPPSAPVDSDAGAAPQGQKRKAEEAARESVLPTSSNLERVPLRDSTISDRNNHNQVARKIPGTPRKNKGKQKALPTTPGAPKLSQESFLSSSPSPRRPYTPIKPPTALRSRALATTGQESYLTLIASSPATSSPVRGIGRVSFTSPFRPRTSPAKRSDRDFPPQSEDAMGNLTASSPRYPFEFNIHNSSPYMSSFEPIPLELGNLGPAHWTPPSLGPPAPVSEPTSRSLSRASSVGDDVDPDDKEADGDDADMELHYPDWSSPSERVQYRRRSSQEDFDMDAYLDLEGAGPISEPNLPATPYKNTTARGLQFSKEYGLLSPSEVERITASVLPGFVEEAKSSKRRKVEVS